jgi:hypothetical protein
MTKECVWGKWMARQDCLRNGGNTQTKKPKGIEYQGQSERGIHYYRKSDETSWLETVRCKDGKEIYVNCPRKYMRLDESETHALFEGDIMRAAGSREDMEKWKLQLNKPSWVIKEFK